MMGIGDAKIIDPVDEVIYNFIVNCYNFLEFYIPNIIILL